ncbi:acyltransferase [Mucilaginibacter sp. Bleaf8]|uniref:acyltransferase family protein n=1 Tax=Mucilaginibacter sp. Bleaf8 TaxID=2834430 RepID=UPI001BCD433A|nr:acyltransferase [Mucilaginibacter sp. Bleaf8]MBS7567061.1 acyltransferase [Mucilaginibacter sp. Bleaf8]
MNKAEPNSNPFTTRQHFEILDGLRGVAAVAVVIFHFMEFVVPDYTKSFIAHAYLAVDFFFCLSGFVIAYAYDNRLQTLGIFNFFKMRLIRLHPLVIVGSILGLLAFVFDPYSKLYQVYGIGKAVLMFLASCLLIPYPVVKERYFNLFHLNPPSWSLFWEYVANIFYALILFRLKNKFLWVLTVIAAAALCYEASRSGNLAVGWGGDNVTGGGIRVFYSFLIGMLVYRSSWILKSRLGFLAVSVLLMLAFLAPFVVEANRFTDPLIVLFYFPFLVALGAGAQLKPGLKKLCKFSGDLSYPLYMIHYPFLWLFLSYIEVKKPSMAQMEMIIPIATLLLIALAYLIMAFVDIPVRRYLKKRLA